MSELSKFYILERLAKGFANHRRIEILFLLQKKDELSVEEIAQMINMHLNTSGDHIRKMAQSGLVMKRHDGLYVRHALTNKGKEVLKFLTSLN